MTNLLRPLDRTLDVKGLRLHVLDWGGEGRTPVLLLHGDSDPADTYNPIAAFDDVSGMVEQLGLSGLILIGLSMGGRNAIYFTHRRPDLVRKLVILDIGPEISRRATEVAPGPPEPDTWDSI